VRYEALMLAAFLTGVLGAMSQQSVTPPVRSLPEAATPLSAASQPQPAVQIAAAALAPEALPAFTAPVTAKEVAAQAAPVKRAPKLARKHKPRPEIAAAPPPEPPHHSFWYRLFHKAPDSEQVATAETR
jgi:hypothetical protein